MREASWSAPALWRFGNGANERRRALAKPMPACFATLLRPGTGTLRRSGENCRCQIDFGMDDRGKRRLNLFMCQQKACDIVDTERLQKFLKKREEWLSWLNGEDQHSIWRQITSLLWDYALFKTIRELRIEAAQNPIKEIGFNTPVLRLLEAGFVFTQATGIRRLSEKQWRDPTKHIISLKALLDEIKTERELLTREVYLACHGLPYEPEPAKKRFYDSLASSGKILSYVGMDTSGPEAWASSERAHNHFDKLSDVSVPGRSRDDLIPIAWFDSLELKIKSCDDICVLADKFIAHAAHPTSLVGLTKAQTQVTLSQLKACYQAIIEVTTSVGVQILQDSVTTTVPVPQFDLLENLDKQWISEGGMSKARDIWEKNCDEIEVLASLRDTCQPIETK